MKHKYLLTLFALICTICAFPFYSFAQEAVSSAKQTSFDLRDVLVDASKFNPTLKEARARYYSVAENLAQAKAGFRPSVSIDSSISNIQTDNEGADLITVEGGNFEQSVTASLAQPIFRGGSTVAQVKAAKNNILAQEWVLRNIHQNVYFDILRTYHDITLARRVLDLEQENSDILQRRLDETEARFRVGEFTRTDIAQAKARLADSYARISQSRANLRSAEAEYKKLTGVSYVPSSENLNFLLELPQTRDAAIAYAHSNNPSLVASRYAHNASIDVKRQIKGELLPQVDISAQKRRRKDPHPGFVEQTDTDAVALSATLPLYSGGATRSRLRQSQYLIHEHAANIGEGELDVTERVTRSWENFKAAQQTISAREEQVQAASIAYEGVQKEEEVGLRTAIDVLDANRDVLTARVDMEDAKRNLHVLKFDLARSIGALTPQSLGIADVVPNSADVMKKIGSNWIGTGVNYIE